nr:chemosensory protein protein 24 [Diaphania glauculalis]
MHVLDRTRSFNIGPRLRLDISTQNVWEHSSITMWYQLACLVLYLTAVKPEMTASGIDLTITGGVKDKGFKVIYGDEDMTVINEVVGAMEKSEVLKAKVQLNEAIKPLQVEDVKCLMSVDKYCTKDMRQVKGVLIQALKNDCNKCSIEEKESAGKVAAAMMAHDPVAWKLFLTRYDALDRVQRIVG